MPTEVMTMCFHTRDAVERTDSSFTFRLPSARLRNDAVKVALASCEFPMVQWTVEEDWNRLYTNEGIALDADTQELRFACDGMTAPVVVHLPVRLNPITKAVATRGGATVRVTCALPHGLAALAAADAGARLVGGSAGDVVVAGAASVDAHTFDLACAAGAAQNAQNAHTLLVPAAPNPTRLCAWMQAATRRALLLHSVTNVQIHFRYDARTDTVRVTASATEATPMLRFLPSELLRRCGVSHMPVRCADYRAEWPCEPTRFWDHVLVPPGFYAPCHRPMCTGQPMRFGAELEAAVNRLYFPVLKDQQQHLVVFSDPSGRTLTCAVPSGRYAPAQLCDHLSAAMTAAAAAVDAAVEFSVHHDERDRFVFACERRAGGALHPAPFGLLFHHPACIDAERLGFPAQPLYGADTYVAPQSCRCARGAGGRVAANVVRFAEVVAQKRFSVHVTTPPPMVAVTLGRGAHKGTVRVRTHVNGTPFAHGLQPGDAVRVAECGAVTLADGTAVEGVRVPLPHRCTCLVVADGGADATVATLRVPALAGLDDAEVAFQVACEVQPWNVCFDVHPRSLPAHLLGFPVGATQWGVDGSVADADDRLLPPFVAPRTHCLDHPDYVLLTFSESAGATLEHAYDDENRQVFCKLSLYPLFREERMLPRDTTLLRNNLTTFTLAFWNPDLRTPYRFHGADFSFSLNFVAAVPE